MGNNECRVPSAGKNLQTQKDTKDAAHPSPTPKGVARTGIRLGCAHPLHCLGRALQGHLEANQDRIPPLVQDMAPGQEHLPGVTCDDKISADQRGPTTFCRTPTSGACTTMTCETLGR